MIRLANAGGSTDFSINNHASITNTWYTYSYTNPYNSTNVIVELYLRDYDINANAQAGSLHRMHDWVYSGGSFGWKYAVTNSTITVMITSIYGWSGNYNLLVRVRKGS